MATQRDNLRPSPDEGREMKEFLLEKKSTLVKMIGNFERKEKIREEVGIIILAENDIEGKQLTDYIVAKGFVNVFFETPKPGSDEKLVADVVIFHRQEMGRDNVGLTDRFISDYIKKNWQAQSLLYFGPYNRVLDTRTDQIVFANYQQKLVGNIFELLLDR